jgi:hypothetical protein
MSKLKTISTSNSSIKSAVEIPTNRIKNIELQRLPKGPKTTNTKGLAGPRDK